LIARFNACASLELLIHFHLSLFFAQLILIWILIGRAPQSTTKQKYAGD